MRCFFYVTQFCWRWMGNRRTLDGDVTLVISMLMMLLVWMSNTINDILIFILTLFPVYTPDDTESVPFI